MKNIMKIIILVLVLPVVISSCYKENLDPVPKLSISDLTAFDTRDRIVAQVKGMYASFKDGQYLGGRFQVYNDIRSDDWLNLGQNGVTGLMTWNHTVTASQNEVQNLWGAIYAAVNRVNMFLDGLEANETKILTSNVLTQEEFDRYKGEALALRGMAYFHLIQLYAQPYKKGPQNWGAVLRLTAQKSSADNSKARATLQETYDQILSDLNTAEGLLPTIANGTANGADYVTRMHKNTVVALKTRVYLHMDKWAEVITEANKIVSAAAPFTSPLGVAYQLSATFGGIFSNYTSSEAILSMPMSGAELPGTQNGLAHYFSGATVGNNEYPVNEQSVMWSSPVFTTSDARKQLTVVRTIGGTDRIFINKYPTFPHTDWAPVIRYAEVLLNLAEAEARANGVNARAIALLNAVYLRSNAGGTPYVAGDFANVDAFVNRLLLERNIEFLGEGIRNMDTGRLLASHAAKPGVNAVSPNDPNYVWPIPQTELNTNQLIQPN